MADGHGSEADADIIAWNGLLIRCICLGLRITILPLLLLSKPCGVPNSDLVIPRAPLARLNPSVVSEGLVRDFG